MTRCLTRATATLLLSASCSAFASYSSHPEAASFIADMRDQHGFSAAEVEAVLDRASRNDRVLELIRPPAKPGQRSWQNYRARFLTEGRINNGVRFWQENESTITAASERYGVPPEYIVSIVGVETHYGSYTGSFETVSALATLAFDYPPRAELFRRELENLLVLSREQGRDPFSFRGSYAGALGYPQFLPSSIRAYAVDFDGDGRIDFESGPTDAIGSIANYFSEHGWEPGQPVVTRVAFPPELDPAPLIAAGIEPSLDTVSLVAEGFVGLGGTIYANEATLFDLPTPGADTQYWLGYRNFYVITRYNRSSFYAMSVYELAEAVRQRFEARQTAQR